MAEVKQQQGLLLFIIYHLFDYSKWMHTNLLKKKMPSINEEVHQPQTKTLPKNGNIKIEVGKFNLFDLIH
jgi:hypothetical protein